MEKYELAIQGLQLWVRLGCSEAERAYPQPVEIEVRILFDEQPVGCRSDQLADVCCYQAVVEGITTLVEERSFKLIEFLAAEIFDRTRPQLKAGGAMLEVAVIKLRSPVPHVQRGMRFIYSRRVS